MAPGPARSGIASGTTATFSFPRASSSSESVLFAGLIFAFIMAIDMRRRRTPPPILNEAIDIPKSFRIHSPIKHDTTRMIATESEAT